VPDDKTEIRISGCPIMAERQGNKHGDLSPPRVVQHLAD
jgi:hypothetical protein